MREKLIHLCKILKLGCYHLEDGFVFLKLEQSFRIEFINIQFAYHRRMKYVHCCKHKIEIKIRDIYVKTKPITFV